MITMIINDHAMKKYPIFAEKYRIYKNIPPNVPPQKVSDMTDITVSLWKCHSSGQQSIWLRKSLFQTIFLFTLVLQYVWNMPSSLQLFHYGPLTRWMESQHKQNQSSKPILIQSGLLKCSHVWPGHTEWKKQSSRDFAVAVYASWINSEWLKAVHFWGFRRYAVIVSYDVRKLERENQVRCEKWHGFYACGPHL